VFWAVIIAVVVGAVTMNSNPPIAQQVPISITAPGANR
jgi:hypothetical protein